LGSRSWQVWASVAADQHVFTEIASDQHVHLTPSDATEHKKSVPSRTLRARQLAMRSSVNVDEAKKAAG
jgi:hypothetical protein